VRFFVGAEYDDKVRIETSIIELRSRTVTFAYRAVRGDELLAAGWTRHLCVDPENRFRRLPAEITEAISPYILPEDERFFPS
jgi:acyl-CoA thioester hydrolase